MSAAVPAPLDGAATLLAKLFELLTGIAALLATAVAVREGRIALDRAEKVLIVAPHQDDCVLAAGGFGLRNRRLGGETHIVYLVQPDDPQMAATRSEEALSAWQIADVDARHLSHLSLLPAAGPLSLSDIERAAATLQTLVDAVAPSIVVTPLFEGGHLHHDVAHHIVTRMLVLPEGARIYECPLYSPYFSLWRTPHAALAQLARFAFVGRLAYYPKSEGAGVGHMLNLRLSRDELRTKREMLRAFRSQNGEALACHHGYADRLVLWRPQPFRATPFAYRGSRPWLVERLQSALPGRWALRLLPGEPCTIGLERGITDLQRYASRNR